MNARPVNPEHSPALAWLLADDDDPQLEQLWLRVLRRYRLGRTNPAGAVRKYARAELTVKENTQ